MKEKFKKCIAPALYVVLFITFFIAFYFINRGIIQKDDKVYGAAFNSISTCIKWINEFYHMWSGRITLTVLINIFNNLPIEVFKIANSIVMVTCVFLIYKIIKIINNKTEDKFKFIYLMIIFSLIFFISIPVINSGALWLAGSMNYLWPTFGLLISIIPFIAEIQEKKLNHKYYIIFMIANMLSCFAEQTSAVLIVFGAIAFVWSFIDKKKINKMLLIHYGVIVVLSLINLLAPGNAARSAAEEIKWYQSFGMLTTFDKLVQGYIQVANHIVNNTTILFAIMCITLTIIVCKNKEIKKIDKIITFIPVIYVMMKLLGLVFAQKEGIILNKINILFNFENFAIKTLYTKTNLIQLILSCFVISIIACELFVAFKNKKAGIISTILYCASLCSALILSFSPTIYASGNRVYLLTDFLFVLVDALLIMELLPKIKSRILKVIMVNIIAILAVICYIYLCKDGINKIIY